MPDLRDAPTINALWAGLLIEELVRQGVGLFCLAPGSRSAPLTLAAAQHPAARHLMHFDERGTAFAALGYARATGRPAVWITTSGTAVANGLPAAVEADEDGVPLLLLTADRPPELRDTAANQTVRQPELFAPFARYRADLAVPTAAIGPAYVLTSGGPGRRPRARPGRRPRPPQCPVSRASRARPRRLGSARLPRRPRSLARHGPSVHALHGWRRTPSRRRAG